MPLSPSQIRLLQDWMRSTSIVSCPACGQSRWRLDEAAYVRGLLEGGESDLTESAGVVKVPCGSCGHLLLFDAGTIGIRGSWAEERGL